MALSRRLTSTSQSIEAVRAKGFFRNTPLVPGPRNCLLKLDNLQSSGSFKDRGIGYMMHQVSAATKVSRFICSSGGNAGMAVASAGQKLATPVEVFVPTTTMAMMVERLRGYGATVVVEGANWNEADRRARQRLEEVEGAQYVPPFDHPLIWEGHSSVVEEIAASGARPDAIVVSVGGGGLLIGVQQGLERLGWLDVDVLAMETEGAASFNAAVKANRVVSLASISSLATSLGALAVSPETLRSSVPTHSLVVSDGEAVGACLAFAQDHRMLVEPACGAALASVYSSRLEDVINRYRQVVVIVCGGGAVTIDLLVSWKKNLAL